MINREGLLQLKNKEFIFTCLELLRSKSKIDYISVLINPDSCKRKFDMYYSILQEIPAVGSIQRDCFMDATGNRRYYPNTFEVNGRRFIVCNDWYYNINVNRRDTRTDFVNWVLAQVHR